MSLIKIAITASDVIERRMLRMRAGRTPYIMHLMHEKKNLTEKERNEVFSRLNAIVRNSNGMEAHTSYPQEGKITSLNIDKVVSRYNKMYKKD